jgi:hypothetical protein
MPGAFYPLSKEKRGADSSAGSSTIELKDNTIIVVLGASGDLAKKKTVSNRPVDVSAH